MPKDAEHRLIEPKKLETLGGLSFSGWFPCIYNSSVSPPPDVCVFFTMTCHPKQLGSSQAPPTGPDFRHLRRVVEVPMWPSAWVRRDTTGSILPPQTGTKRSEVLG